VVAEFLQLTFKLVETKDPISITIELLKHEFLSLALLLEVLTQVVQHLVQVSVGLVLFLPVLDLPEVIVGIFVHLQHEELVVPDLELFSGEHIGGVEEFAGHLIQVDAFLEETPGDDTQIPLRGLVDHDFVVLEVVSTKESPHQVLFRDFTREFQTENQLLALVKKQLTEVLYGLLRPELPDRTIRVFKSTHADIRRDFLFREFFLGQFDVDLLLQSLFALFLVVSPREAILVVHSETLVVDLDLASDKQVVKAEILFFLILAVHRTPDLFAGLTLG